MWEQISLPGGNATLPLRAKAREGLLSQNVASGRNARLLWTAFGFACLMLIGVSACLLLPFASHAPTKTALLVPAAAAMAGGDLTFNPPLPVLNAGSGRKHSLGLRPRHPPSRTHRHNFATRGPATWRARQVAGHSGSGPDKVRSIDTDLWVPSMRSLWQRMTANSKGGDDDFQTVLSRLAPAKELPKLRDAYRHLEQQMNDAAEKGEYAKAIRYRNMFRVLRSEDPAPLAKATRQAMWQAAETDDFEAAAKYRDQLKNLRSFLPEYLLEGTWIGTVPDQEGQEGGQVRVELAYNGNSVSASQNGVEGILNADPSDGSVLPLLTAFKTTKMLFEADVSEPKKDPTGIVSNGTTCVEYFEGTGHLDGDITIPGKLYLIADGVIGFSFEPGDNGGDKELAFAGGGGGAAVIGGESNMAAAGAKGGRGEGDGDGEGDGGGEGGGSLFVVFKRRVVDIRAMKNSWRGESRMRPWNSRSRAGEMTWMGEKSHETHRGLPDEMDWGR